MKARGVVLAALIASVGCQEQVESTQERVAVRVGPEMSSELVADRDADAEQRLNRAPVEVTDATAAQGAGPDGEPWMPSLRKVCKEVLKKRTTRHTEGWEKWKGKVDLSVRDFRVYSPAFKKWNLSSVDDPTKAKGVKHRGPFYGFGLTIELENKSDEVLSGDNIYVWATFTSKTGKRECFADATASRSWNPYAKKGKGAWVKEKAYSEWPLRPSERKRYTVTNSTCFSEMFVETEPTDVKVEVYARFRPLGQTDAVVAGPLETLNRKGGLLRGLPTADSTSTQQIRTKKAPIPVRVLYGAGDHVLVAEDKKLRWVANAFIVGTGPQKPLPMGDLPASTETYNKTFGSLTLKIDNWKTENWGKYEGKLKQGQKMISADVSITVDTSSVQTALEAAVTTATNQVTEARAALTAKETALSAAETTLATAKGTDGEKAAKDAVKAAKAEAKAAGKAVKAAEKGLKNAEKAMGGGVSKFLKAQAKAVDCGSFKVDVGRKQLKAFKGSMGKKECKAIEGGQAVKGRIMFAVERWDMPFVLSWKGTGGAIQTHRIASSELGKILKD